MQGLHGRVFLAMAVAMSAISASAQSADHQPGALQVLRYSSLSDLREQPWRFDAPLAALQPFVYQVDGARFVKLHFSRFELPEGVILEVSDPAGKETWRYSAGDRDPFTVDRERGDDGQGSFWSMSVNGDAVVVRLTGDLLAFDPAIHGFEIDDHLTDVPVARNTTKRSNSDAPDFGGTESTCGTDELRDAVCWIKDYPDHYERGLPVALIITASGKQCTAWRAGSENRMFTARHCLPSQGELDGAEIWFDYEATVCGGGEATDPVKVTGDELLFQHYKLDVSLFSVNDFSRIRGFGNLGLDLRDGRQGEEIFIPQHGLGNPKQIAIESDMDSGGLCAIDDNAVDGFYEASDIGYKCDTTTSSSGSPVISGETGRALAVHHWGGCNNSGTKLSLVWPLIEDFFDGVPEGNSDGDWAEPNKAPSARFTAECDSMSCVFDASGSRDSDGSIVSYDWQIDGQEHDGRKIQHEFDKEGEYEVLLIVKDDEGAHDTADDVVSVSKPNQAPEARFSSRCVGRDCALDASGSSDPDGEITTWYWDLGDGTKASGETLSHRYDEDGNYWIELTIRDDDGDKGTDGHSVNVATANQDPVASFSVDCDALLCKVDASASSDSDGTVVAWHWDFGDGRQASGAQAEHEYDASGSFLIRLEVEDDDGARSDRTKQVEVKGGNLEPDAAFSFECEADLCRFDASGSSDTDGRITAWSWQFGDGTKGSGETIEHRYSSSGTFTVRLDVTDDAGAADDKVRLVKVEIPADEPVAEFSVSCEGLNCTLDAGSSTASDGSIARYDWSFGDGTTASGGAVSHEYGEEGLYTVTLKVTDNNQASGTRKRTIQVEAEAPPEIALAASLISGKRPAVQLDWNDAQGSEVAIYRDGQRLAEVANDGQHIDQALWNVAPTARYRVCEVEGGRCSNPVKLQLNR